MFFLHTALCYTNNFLVDLFDLLSLVGTWWIVFTNGPGDRGSIPGRVIPKTLKIGLDASLVNTQQYKVRIKG